MLLTPTLAAHGFYYDNWNANPVVGSIGTSVTPGASNAEGSWTQIASSANISTKVVALMLWVQGGASSAAIKSHLLDIGVDPAGGTSYTAIVSNIVCGHSASTTATPHIFLLPIQIPSGASVAVRIQGSNATAGTVTVAARFFGKSSAPWTLPSGSYSETIGTITGSEGVSFTPGNAADGAWVSLGTNAKPLWWLQLCVQVSNAALTQVATYVDLAVGDASNKLIVIRDIIQTTTAETVLPAMKQNLVWHCAYRPIPAGTNIYVRGRSNVAPNTGWNAVAVGIGG